MFQYSTQNIVSILVPVRTDYRYKDDLIYSNFLVAYAYIGCGAQTAVTGSLCERTTTPGYENASSDSLGHPTYMRQ